jgi:hypothetical protein
MALTPAERAELKNIENVLRRYLETAGIKAKAQAQMQSGEKLQADAAIEQRKLAPYLNLAHSVRPTLSGLGMLGGGAVGSGGGPSHAFAGGALGYAAGEGLGKAFEAQIGLRSPVTLPEAIRSSIGDVLSGAGAQAVGATVPLVGRGLTKAGRGMARIFEGTTGVPRREFIALTKDPGAIFTAKTLDKAGGKLKAVEDRFGIAKINTPEEAVQKLSPVELFADSQNALSKKAASKAFTKIKYNLDSTENEIVEGIRGIDTILRKTPQLDTEKRNLLELTRKRFVQELSKKAPELQQARSEMARSLMASKFRQPFPVTQTTGKPSVGRMAFSGATLGGAGFLLGGIPGLGLISTASPLVTGLGTSATGGLMKASQALLGNQNMRNMLLGSATSALKKSNVIRDLFGTEGQ